MLVVPVSSCWTCNIIDLLSIAVDAIVHFTTGDEDDLQLNVVCVCVWDVLIVAFSKCLYQIIRTIVADLRYVYFKVSNILNHKGWSISFAYQDLLKDKPTEADCFAITGSSNGCCVT